MSPGGEEPAGNDSATVRPWVKACGIALIAAVCLPLLGVLGLGAFLWYHSHRARTTAEESRAAVRVGSSLGEAVLSAESAAVGIRCFQAGCAEPAEKQLAFRAEHALHVFDDRPESRVESREEWRERLLALDAAGCRTAVFTFCGRPWITLTAELDAEGRVRRVGELRITGD